MTDIARLFREKDLAAIQVLRGGRESSLEQQTDDTLYRFDSGATISFQEGSHNVLAIGGVGRGKTASIVLPMAARLIKAGMPGLIIDVKNNLTDRVRAIARRYGREDNILEIGTRPTAERFNLLHGQLFSEIERLISTMIMHRICHAGNADWTYKGIRITTDIAYLLTLLAEAGQRAFQPSFALIAKMLGDYGFSRRVFNSFHRSHADPCNPRHASFITRMANEAFHPLNKRLDRTLGGDNEWEMQLTWMLHHPRRVLEALCRDSDLLTHFSHPDGNLTIDFKDLLYKQRKIVVLRFGVGQGDVGSLIAKWLKERFYKDVYERFDAGAAPSSLFTFLLLDEFQDILDVDDDNPLDDFSWFSKSREFRNINIAASQALSSLYVRGHRERIDGLIANCSAKLLMQTDDPAADAWFRHFTDLERPLHKLANSECVLAKYDLKARQALVSHEFVTEEFRRTQAILASSDKGDGLELAAEGNDAHLQRVEGHSLLLEKAVERAVDPPGWLKEPHLLYLYYKYLPLWDFDGDYRLDFPKAWLPRIEDTLERIQALDEPVRISRLAVFDGELNIEAVPEHALLEIISEAATSTSAMCMKCGGTSDVKEVRVDGVLRTVRLCGDCRVENGIRASRR